MKNAVSPDRPPFIVIFTDLDGTLLDHVTYDWKEAAPALNLCERLSVPVILVSSKTRAEMDVLRSKLRLSFPFISENGGGVFFPREGSLIPPYGTDLAADLYRLSLGVPYGLLVKHLAEIRDELGWAIQGFSQMTLEEISRHTGLGAENARLAAKREYDEPFILMEQRDIDTRPLYEAARRRGLYITTGGRFYHLHGKTDKGGAVEKIISWYQDSHPELLTIGLGDSPNDFTMLKRVDYPILVRSSREFPGIEEDIPGLRITQEFGPKGWNLAVAEILRREADTGQRP